MNQEATSKTVMKKGQTLARVLSAQADVLTAYGHQDKAIDFCSLAICLSPELGVASLLKANGIYDDSLMNNSDDEDENFDDDVEEEV